MIEQRIDAWARTRPESIALVNDGMPISYATLARAVGIVRRFLAQSSLPAAGTAVVLAAALPDTWLILLGLRSLGLTTVVTPTIAQADELHLRNVVCVVTMEGNPQINDVLRSPFAATRMVIVPTSIYTAAHYGNLPALPEGLPPYGGHILYTSGTTGTFKKVLTDAEGDRKRCEAAQKIQGLDERAVYHGMNFGPWTVAGYRRPLVTWNSGGRIIFDQRPDRYQRVFYRPITRMFLDHQMLKDLLLAREGSTDGIQPFELELGGALLPAALADNAYRLLTDRITINYGSTELGSMVLKSRYRSIEDIYWLTPAEDRTIQILDEDGNECPLGQEGLLRVGLTDLDIRSYLDDPETTARVFRDGFFYPGDMAVRREDGRIRILGRSADVLNLQGKKIAVGPLEAAIQRHLNVEDVCLFAGLDDEGHEELVVAIQSDREPGKPQLDAVVRDFASFERVRFVVLKEFPRGDTGMSKVRRTALRRMVVPPTKSG